MIFIEPVNFAGSGQVGFCPAEDFLAPFILFRIINMQGIAIGGVHKVVTYKNIFQRNVATIYFFRNKTVRKPVVTTQNASGAYPKSVL